MSAESAPSLLILHAVRVLGFADSGAIARHARSSGERTRQVLHEAAGAGWGQHAEFADLHGWSLTDAGRTENERQLAAERQIADPDDVIAAVYRDFLPCNERLLRAVTDWQIKPTPEDRFASNNHTDNAWDTGVRDELAVIGGELTQLNARLTRVLARFEGYATRYQAALLKAVTGKRGWVDKTNVDSCHRVWFQLHEDLVATLGIDRGTET